MKFRSTTVLLCLLVAATAHAQLQRTFVSSTGNDANPCSRSLPCRNFAAAVTAVAEGGEVVVLDSAGYGPVSITKSVSIIAPQGIYGGITATAGDAVTVNVTSLVSATVTLRGLTLNGQGADYGVDVQAIETLHIENCEIAKFANSGVFLFASGHMNVTDTVVRESSQEGIAVSPNAGSADATIDRCRLSFNNGGGVYAGANGTVTVSNSVLANNSNGLIAYVGTASVKNSVLSSNNIGMFVFGSATVWIADTVFSANGYGIDAESGAVHSFGTNQMSGNTTANTTGAATFNTVAQY